MKSTERIHTFWSKKAKIFRTGGEASWGDLLMKREVSELVKHLHDGNSILDVGCANGASSIQFVTRKQCAVLGIDYVPDMIRNANAAKKKLPASVAKRITFMVGNALRLPLPDNQYDTVISTRCICNLTTLKEQMQAVHEMWRVLSPGGTLLLSEPTIQGLSRLNAIGTFFGLKPLVQPWHNLYVDEKKLIKFSRPLFSVSIDYFSSTYYVISRIFYRWVKGDDASKLRRDSFLNKIGILLPSVGTWGVQRLYIMKKL